MRQSAHSSLQEEGWLGRERIFMIVAEGHWYGASRVVKVKGACSGLGGPCRPVLYLCEEKAMAASWNTTPFGGCLRSRHTSLACLRAA